MIRVSFVACLVCGLNSLGLTQSENPNRGAAQQNALPASVIAESGSLTGLAGCEMHVIGIYSPGTPAEKDDRVYVEVQATGKPMVVVLTSYFGGQWHLKVAPGADVRHVIIAGYFAQDVSDDFPPLPKSVLTYFPRAEKSKTVNYFYAYAWHTAEGRNMRSQLKQLTGLEVTTFQGSYQGREFIIDGQRGDLAALEAKPTALGRERIETQKDEAPSVDMANLEATRAELLRSKERWETTLKAQEAESRELAARHRELTQREKSNDQGLKALEEKLRATVTQAFHAQAQLQQVRRQLAALELGELQVQQQQRMSLAEQIIARRVSDLLNQNSLAWPHDR